MWLAHYAKAVRLGLFRRELPFAHIVLSPCVPLVKYAGPVVGIWAVYSACGMDSMHIRMIADEDAQNGSCQTSTNNVSAQLPNST